MAKNSLSKLVLIGGLVGLAIIMLKGIKGHAFSIPPIIDNSKIILPRPFRTTPVRPPIVNPPVVVPPAPVSSKVADPHAPATQMPILPPGTRPEVADAVQRAFDDGTLTNQQAEAVSQPYAPLYNPDPANTIDYTVRDSSGNVVSTTATVVDFGSPEAAQAALDAYMHNFV